MDKKPREAAALRSKAEAQLADAPTRKTSIRSAEDLLHELRVHQIELEMQNDELRQAQIALEESRDRYVDLYEFAPVGYITLDHAGMIAGVNLTAAALLGVDRKKLIKHRFAGFVAADSHDHWYRHFSLTRQGQSLQSCELVLKRNGDSHFHAQLDCVNSQNCDNSSVRIILTDISARKQIEDELRIAAITFQSSEGIVVTDADGIILRVNGAFTKLTGYSEAEAVGKTPALLSSGRHDKSFYMRMWTSMRQEHYWQGEMWNKRKNGKIYAEWLTISAVLAPDGSITHYVGSFSDITKDSEAEAEIHRLAYYDPLTQLPNRRLLIDRLGQALAASRRNGRYGALLFLDLDNFKTLNDTRGHDVGDLLLVEIAQRLHDNVREGDTVGRLGGDEFVVMLEDLSEDAQMAALQAGIAGMKVRDAIAMPYMLKGLEFTGTASIGVSLFCNEGDSVDDLLKHADLAMYHAKEGGRNSLRFFDPEMQAVLDERSAMESDLRHALERKQLSLHYQIQIDATRSLIGAEALLRWEHPERGQVSPAQFIPLAEDTGLILPIGLWVLQTACAQIKAWSDSPVTRGLQLAINVSARQFRQSNFVEQVQQTLAASSIDPQYLKIELTESLVLDNVSDTVIKMNTLKEMGVSLSMDDFGTGYSSLSYLKLLPLDQLKIDQSFVRNVASDANDAAIVKAIITMGRTFGLHVIAEGVESSEQHEFLDQHGCHGYQGYLFGKPMPIDQFNEWVRQRA
ncbi:MAG: EAL domain-containing protein [Sideroxyarcus sp.]|nr:EAL domain-containing protein [Sideroxyarcus sp.]